MALQMALKPCVRVEHEQVCLGLSVGRGHGCQRARAQEGSRQEHGAPDGSPVPTCRQPSAHLSPLTLCIVTTVTPTHTHL